MNGKASLLHKLLVFILYSTNSTTFYQNYDDNVNCRNVPSSLNSDNTFCGKVETMIFKISEKVIDLYHYNMLQNVNIKMSHLHNPKWRPCYF
jgi:hypothetical protein